MKTGTESSASRVASFEPLLALLTVFSRIELEEIGFAVVFNTYQDYYIQNINKLTGSIKGCIMHLLGDIINKLKDSISDDNQATYFRNLISQLDRQLLSSSGKESELALISGLFRGLDSFLNHDPTKLTSKPLHSF